MCVVYDVLQSCVQIFEILRHTFFCNFLMHIKYFINTKCKISISLFPPPLSLSLSLSLKNDRAIFSYILMWYILKEKFLFFACFIFQVDDKWCWQPALIFWHIFGKVWVCPIPIHLRVFHLRLDTFFIKLLMHQRSRSTIQEINAVMNSFHMVICDIVVTERISAFRF